jgi:hypothetical protein
VSTFSHEHTFRYIGKKQRFKVPAGVTEIRVIAIGAEGGGSTISHGGRVSAILPVNAGETLFVRVGGNGTSTAGYNGGGKPGAHGFEKGNSYGGGGASDIREDGDALSNRVLVAGGGGGQGGWDAERGHAYGVGGAGGGLTAGSGTVGFGDYSYSSGCGSGRVIDDVSYGGCPGTGGTQSAGGTGGIGGEGVLCYGTQGANGAFGVGGQGASAGLSSSSNRYYECGGLGGGGGGGYFGGGGGGEAASYGSSPIGGGGGGGGGSSYVERSATNVHLWRGWKGNEYGLVVISW